jgi:hypothetical protein
MPKRAAAQQVLKRAHRWWAKGAAGHWGGPAH